MEITDYYAESLPTSAASTAGNGAGHATARTIAQTINPFKATGAVMLLWGTAAGFINFRKFRQGKITKNQAIADTAGESVGMGLAAGLGLLADGIVKTYIIAAAAPTVIPFAVGVAVTTSAKITWDCKIKKRMKWCDNSDRKKSPADLYPRLLTV